MRFESAWTGLVYVFNFLTLSSPTDRESPSHDEVVTLPHGGDSYDEVITLSHGGNQEKSWILSDKTPIVGTPKNEQEGIAGGLNCSYPKMKDWVPCYEIKNRTCWLRKSDNSSFIDINTDYEDPLEVPNGTTRKVKGLRFG
jgi:hypothetical protein